LIEVIGTPGESTGDAPAKGRNERRCTARLPRLKVSRKPSTLDGTSVRTCTARIFQGDSAMSIARRQLIDVSVTRWYHRNVALCSRRVVAAQRVVRPQSVALRSHRGARPNLRARCGWFLGSAVVPSAGSVGSKSSGRADGSAASSRPPGKSYAKRPVASICAA
jgi:hypothetical protein